MFVYTEYILDVIILLDEYSFPRHFHLLGALKKNVGGNKFEIICEVETVLTSWLITRTLISEEYRGCNDDKMNASAVPRTTWKSNETAVQLHFNCSYSTTDTWAVTTRVRSPRRCNVVP